MTNNLTPIGKREFYNLILEHDVHVFSKVNGDIITTDFKLKGITLVGRSITDFLNMDENGFATVTYYVVPNVEKLLPSLIGS
jgi:hypothetical protein